ncbi:MAG: AI-2E family transporter [Planctomycetota bacterium]
MSERAPSPQPRRPVSVTGPGQVALVLTAVVTGIWAIRAAKAFLIPLVLATFAFLLVGALDRVWGRLRIGEHRLPKPLTTVLSALFITSVGLGMVQLVADNATLVARAAPGYQERLTELQDDFTDWIFFWEEDEDAAAAPVDGEASEGAAAPAVPVAEEPPAVEPPDGGPAGGPAGETERATDEGTGPLDILVEKINIAGLATSVASGLLGLVGNGALVLIYLFFLLLERPFFERKLRAMFPDPRRHDEVVALLDRIDHDVSAYIGLKTLVSLMTALPSYAILLWVGVDFAEFWALVIFVLNFIPNVGSAIATLLPSLIALVQFPTLGPFLRVLIGVLSVQLFVANVIEPSLLGRRLNMSPLVVIVALVGWSLLWGLPGAFLCVPMTNILLLVLANIRSTRWIGVLLSRDGHIAGSNAT